MHREAAQKAIFFKGHFRALSVIFTWLFLMLIFTIRYSSPHFNYKCQINFMFYSVTHNMMQRLKYTEHPSQSVCLCVCVCVCLIQQYPLAFAVPFSQWMCSNAWLYRLLATMDRSELSAPAALITRGARILVRTDFTCSLEFREHRNVLFAAHHIELSSFPDPPPIAQW